MAQRPLNVLHLTTFYPPHSFGGDAMYIYRLSHALGDAGHHVEVVHCVDAYHMLHPAPPPIEFSEHPNVLRHELRSGFGALSPLLTHQTGQPWLKSRQIHEILQSREWDVLHFHNTSLLGPGVLKLTPRGERAVKLYTTHEHWLICPTHVLWKMDSGACDKPECLPCILQTRRPPQIWRYTGVLDECAKHVDEFVSPSRFTARMHAERGFSRPVGVLPYFIPRADGDWREPAPRPHERPYFVFVGRLEKIKGLQTLIHLWNRIADYDLVVAGTGAYDAELRAMAADNPRIRFVGPRPQRELGALYYHAIACIVPSITYETFGIIMAEAFARKTPVIARDLGALPEVIEESGGGFSYRTDEELEAAMRRIAESPRLRTKLGTQGYNTFVERWSPEAHMKLYMSLVRTTAQNKFGYVPWEENAGAASALSGLPRT